MSETSKILSSLDPVDTSTFVGQYGRLFYSVPDGIIRISDGVTPGGIPITSEAGNVPYSNINVARYIPTDPTILGIEADILGLQESQYSNANLVAYLPLNTANVSAGYFFGNGAFLTGLPITVQSSPSVANNWLSSFNANTGAFTHSQPNFTNIAGTVAVGQLPIASNVSLGIVQPDGSTIKVVNGIISVNNGNVGPANTPFIPHYWLTSYNSTTGAFTQTQPTFSDISGNVLLAQLPIATVSSLGILRPDGNSITISNGVISTTGNIVQPVNVGPVPHQWVNSYNALTGQWTLAQPAFGDISGTVATGQLPNPTLTQIGGIMAELSRPNLWVNGITTSGNATLAQPLFANIGGVANAAQLPVATNVSLGIVQPDGNSITIANGVITAVGSVTPVNLAPTSNLWVNGYNATTGVWVVGQPDFANLSGNAAVSQLPLATPNTFGIVRTDNVSIFVSNGVLTVPGSVTPSNVAVTPNLWINGYNAITGAFSEAQPLFSNIGGVAAPSQLPIATVSTVGAVRPDGNTILIDSNGTINTAPVISTILGYVLNTGTTGTNVGPELQVAQASSATKCVVVVKTSDNSIPFTFQINQNGTNIFSSNPTIAAGTAGGTTLTFTTFTNWPLPINANDLFTIDITSGSANWQVTMQLIGYITGSTTSGQLQVVTPITTQGDVIVGNNIGSPVRLGSGNVGNVLTSTGPGNAVVWRSLPIATTSNVGVVKADGVTITVDASGKIAAVGGGSGSGNLVILEQHTASNSGELDFTNWYSAAYDEYEIHFVGIYAGGSGGGFPQLQFSINGGSSWDTGSSYGWTQYAIGLGSSNYHSQPDTSINLVNFSDAAADLSSALRGVLRLYITTGGYASLVGQLKTGRVTDGSIPRPPILSDIAGTYLPTTNPNAFRFIFTGGATNIAAGAIRVYGVGH